jgi:SH3-like domain-containing protein
MSAAVGMTIWIISMAQPVLAEPFAVSVPEANIRSGPGQSKDLLWKVEKYHPLDIVEKKGDWYRFRDFEGDEGWIHKSLVDKIPAVIVKQNNCNVRSGPDTKNETLFKVEKGIPFKVLKREGKWLQVQHADGDTGWIHSSLVWP